MSRYVLNDCKSNSLSTSSKLNFRGVTVLYKSGQTCIFNIAIYPISDIPLKVQVTLEVFSHNEPPHTQLQNVNKQVSLREAVTVVNIGD